MSDGRCVWVYEMQEMPEMPERQVLILSVRALVFKLSIVLAGIFILLCTFVGTEQAHAFWSEVYSPKSLVSSPASCPSEFKEISKFFKKNKSTLKPLFEKAPMREVSFRSVYQRFGMYDPSHAKYDHSEFDRFMGLYRWMEWIPGGPIVFHDRPITEEEFEEKTKYRARQIKRYKSQNMKVPKSLLNRDIGENMEFGDKIKNEAYDLGFFEATEKTIIPSICHQWNDEGELENIMPPGNVSADIYPTHQTPIVNSDLSEYFFNELDLPLVGPVRKIKSFKFHWESGDAFKSRIDFVDYDLNTHQLKKNTDIEAIELVYLDHHVGLFNHIFSRALKLHLDRGVPVKIMVPKGSFWFNLTDDVKALHERLISHGVEIHYYKGLRFPFLNIFKQLNRQIHTKLTLVRRKGVDSVLVGGRNSKDAYYFIGENSDVPYYSNPKRARFQDFDIEVNSELLSQDAKLLYDELWRVGSKFNKKIKLENLNFHQQENIDPNTGNYARYFMSAPFSKHRDYRDVILNLINRSQEKIVMIAPYFILEKKFKDALKNAIARGVEVQLYSADSFGNDNVPAVAKNTFLNEFKTLIEMGGKVKVFRPEGLVLHTKATLFDDQILVTGSGNLDYRSLKYDAENGVILLGKEAIDPFKSEILATVDNASIVFTKQEIDRLSKLLTKLLRKMF